VKEKTSSNECGGYQKPKGHMDSQMFPECKGTPTDRDIVKKTREKRKSKKKTKKSAEEVLMQNIAKNSKQNKQSFNLKKYRIACSKNEKYSR